MRRRHVPKEPSEFEIVVRWRSGRGKDAIYWWGVHRKGEVLPLKDGTTRGEAAAFDAANTIKLSYLVNPPTPKKKGRK
jgi:hypothetical protein